MNAKLDIMMKMIILHVVNVIHHVIHVDFIQLIVQVVIQLNLELFLIEFVYVKMDIMIQESQYVPNVMINVKLVLIYLFVHLVIHPNIENLLQ